MSINSGKFYDAVKMREFCDGWKDLVLNYAEKKVISDNQFSSMRDTESFRGMTADQSKLLVKKGMGRMLREVAKTQKKMRKAQTEVMELFENMVDPSQNARIEYDTLEMINNDFKELYFIYKDRADNVRRIVDCLNNEFGNYAYFEQPDSQTGLDAFYDFCGGDSDTAGYLRKCQDKLAAFDMQAKALLSGKDTMTKTENLNTHIVNTKIALAPAPTSGVTSCKVTLDPVDNSKATANAKKNTKDDMYSYLQSYYGFTDDEMDYLKANYPNLLTTLYNAQSSSTRLEMRTYEKIKIILDVYNMQHVISNGETITFPETGEIVQYNDGITTYSLPVAGEDRWTIEFDYEGAKNSSRVVAGRMLTLMSRYPNNNGHEELLKYEVPEFGDCYAGAMVNGYGEVGDIVKISLSDGSEFNFIILDVKDTNHTHDQLAVGQVQNHSYGHAYLTNNNTELSINACEFMIAGWKYNDANKKIYSAKYYTDDLNLDGNRVTSGQIIGHIDL